MNILTIILKLFGSPIAKAVGGWMKLGGAFMAGKAHQRSAQNKQLLKKIERKRDVEKRIDDIGGGGARKRLHKHWTRPE